MLNKYGLTLFSLGLLWKKSKPSSGVVWFAEENDWTQRKCKAVERSSFFDSRSKLLQTNVALSFTFIVRMSASKQLFKNKIKLGLPGRNFKSLRRNNLVVNESAHVEFMAYMVTFFDMIYTAVQYYIPSWEIICWIHLHIYRGTLWFQKCYFF